MMAILMTLMGEIPPVLWQQAFLELQEMLVIPRLDLIHEEMEK